MSINYVTWTLEQVSFFFKAIISLCIVAFQLASNMAFLCPEE